MLMRAAAVFTTGTYDGGAELLLVQQAEQQGVAVWGEGYTHHHQVEVAGARTADGHDAYRGMYLCAHPAM